MYLGRCAVSRYIGRSYGRLWERDMACRACGMTERDSVNTGITGLNPSLLMVVTNYGTYTPTSCRTGLRSAKSPNKIVHSTPHLGLLEHTDIGTAENRHFYVDFVSTRRQSGYCGVGIRYPEKALAWRGRY